MLRYFPRAWTAEDSLLVGAAMAEMLNHGTYLDDLNREKILARLGPELTGDLYVESSQRDIVPGHDLDEIEPSAAAPDTAQEAAKVAAGGKHSERRRHHRRGSAELSNAEQAELLVPIAEVAIVEVAAGGDDGSDAGGIEQLGDQRSAYGRADGRCWPTTCTCRTRFPNTWYEAHLSCGDFDVAGVTLPGAPWVIVGHNRRIAWGFTNLGPDVEDVFVENFNAAGRIPDSGGLAEAGGAARGDPREARARRGDGCGGDPARADHFRRDEGREPAVGAEVGALRHRAEPAVLRREQRAELGAVPGGVWRASTGRGRTWCMPTWMATSATRRRDWFRCAPRAMVRCR